MLYFVTFDTLMIFMNILMLYLVFIYLKTNTTNHTLIIFVNIRDIYEHTNAIFSIYTYKNNEY